MVPFLSEPNTIFFLGGALLIFTFHDKCLFSPNQLFFLLFLYFLLSSPKAFFSKGCIEFLVPQSGDSLRVKTGKRTKYRLQKLWKTESKTTATACLSEWLQKTPSADQEGQM